MKLIIPFLFGLVLTACGSAGGGGNSSTPTTPTNLIKIVKSDYATPIFMVQGHFKNDANTYMLVAGNQLNMGGAVPVSIVKLDPAGGGTDVTVEILGSGITASVNEPLVADFNNDGIDDIFLPGFIDIAGQNTASQVFLSQPGTHHSRQFLDSTWSHGAFAADLNNDGNIDVIDSNGKMWINNGRGNFTFIDHNWQGNLYWMNGMGVCAGDFLNNGRTQVVITDLNISNGMLPVNDTAVFELDVNLRPISQNLLPAPIYDIGNTSLTEKSHDVRCRVADMNNDGLRDIVVFSRPWASARNGLWTGEGQIQILINQGNLNFVDQTNLIGFNSGIVIDYSPIVKDFNGDGIPDIWSSPQLLISGNGKWTSRSYSTLSNFVDGVPVKINGKWGFAYAKNVDFNKNEIYFTKADLIIDL
jgi:hypothetical protein